LIAVLLFLLWGGAPGGARGETVDDVAAPAQVRQLLKLLAEPAVNRLMSARSRVFGAR
jgi:hypothetical protein